MSEDIPELVKVARDLREIEALTADVDAELEHAGPESDAMVMAGPVANLEAWANLITHAEERHYAECERDNHDACKIAEHATDHDPEWEPPLQTLAFWSEQWRVEHGREMDGRPTVGTEAAFLRDLLGWAYDHEPAFADFAADVRKARVRLENTLRAGERAERSRVPCSNPQCRSRPSLVKVYRDRAEDDHHKCPACDHRYDPDAFSRAYAKHLRSEGAEKYVPVRTARAVLAGMGRSERTIRKWFGECAVHAFCDRTTHEVWVWWPDIWRLHLATQARRRVA